MEERETDRQTMSSKDECSAGEEAEGRRREEPYGVAVWEIADGDGQRAYNRWALREIITGSQKVTNYFNNKFATANMRKASRSPFRDWTNRDGQ